LAVETARINLATARDSLLPAVGFTLGVNRPAKGPTNTTIGLNTTIELNNRQPEVTMANARLGLLEAERNLTKQRASIGIAVRTAVNNATVQLRLIELARGARELAESNLEIEKGKFRLGLVSSFEVAASQDALLQAEQAEVENIIAYLGALTQLDRISGRTLERWAVKLEAAPGSADPDTSERRGADLKTGPR